MKKIIEVNDLKKYYTRGSEIVKALDGVDFSITPGEIVSIVGPSGSGKTTLMNLISCLDSPTDGLLKIDNTDVTGYKESELIEIRRNNLGFIFQRAYLINTLTARENIELPVLFSKKKINSEIISKLIELVGLKGKENIQAKLLSGGDKQKIAIARALVNNPKIIIADEPTSRLETQVRDNILNIFRKLASTGIAIFIATHDLDLAEQTLRIIHLQDGKIIPKEESDLY